METLRGGLIGRSLNIANVPSIFFDIRDKAFQGFLERLLLEHRTFLSFHRRRDSSPADSVECRPFSRLRMLLHMAVRQVLSARRSAENFWRRPMVRKDKLGPPRSRVQSAGRRGGQTATSSPLHRCLAG